MPTTQKIRYSDCDPQAIVFNGNYARYWDDAMTDWLEEAGFGGEELGGSGVEIVTARIEMDFRASARLGDLLTTTVAVEGFGGSSMRLAFTTTKDDGTVVTEGVESPGLRRSRCTFGRSRFPRRSRLPLMGNRFNREDVGSQVWKTSPICSTHPALRWPSSEPLTTPPSTAGSSIAT